MLDLCKFLRHITFTKFNSIYNLVRIEDFKNKFKIMILLCIIILCMMIKVSTNLFI
jgi:hypothetical protein